RQPRRGRPQRAARAPAGAAHRTRRPGVVMAHARATPRSAGGRHAPPAGGDRPTLLQALHSAHWRLGMTAVVAAAVTLTLLSVMTLRTYVDRNLALIARAIAYAAEAAVVFDDAAAAQDTLQ